MSITTSKHQMITQAELKEVLTYNHETGIFTWNSSRGKAIKGGVAGTLLDNGYLCIRYKGKGYKAHRLAFIYMNGFYPTDFDTDHINHIKTDNRWSNLRLVTKSENQRNRSLNANNKYGQTGIYHNKKKDTWQVSITINGKWKTINEFKDKEKAVQARKEAEVKYGFHKNHGLREVA